MRSPITEKIMTIIYQKQNIHSHLLTLRIYLRYAVSAIKNGRRSFYAFKPLDSEFEITVTINAVNATSYLTLKENEVELTFNNNTNKVDTWHWLFQINTRYNEEIRQFSKGELRLLARKFKRNTNGETYEQILNNAIDDYEIDKYDDRKFLKRSFLKEMLNKPDWMGVYDELIAQV